MCTIDLDASIRPSRRVAFARNYIKEKSRLDISDISLPSEEEKELPRPQSKDQTYQIAESLDWLGLADESNAVGRPRGMSDSYQHPMVDFPYQQKPSPAATHTSLLKPNVPSILRPQHQQQHFKQQSQSHSAQEENVGSYFAGGLENLGFKFN